jgi:hypothetical protein
LRVIAESGHLSFDWFYKNAQKNPATAVRNRLGENAFAQGMKLWAKA